MLEFPSLGTHPILTVFPRIARSRLGGNPDREFGCHVCQPVKNSWHAACWSPLQFVVPTETRFSSLSTGEKNWQAKCKWPLVIPRSGLAEVSMHNASLQGASTVCAPTLQYGRRLKRPELALGRLSIVLGALRRCSKIGSWTPLSYCLSSSKQA